MERYGDGDRPALRVRDASLADRVEKSAAYPTRFPVLLAHESTSTWFALFFHDSITLLSRDSRIVKALICD